METTVGTENLKQRLASLVKPVSDLEEAMLVSATYDGDLRLAVLKFYEPRSERIWLWRDNSGHRPYCYTKLRMDELGAIKARKDVVRIEETQKLDLLSDKKMGVRKIIVTDPLAIGGGQNSVRDQIRAWEADIKYYENYAYDEGLRMGVYYKIEEGKISQLTKETPERVLRSVEDIIGKNPPEFVPYIREWAELLGQPLVEFRRIALDIEVANEAGRIPDPEDAVRPIIAVSFFTEKEKFVYLLAKNGREVKDTENLPYNLVLFDREADLIRATFNKIMDYPVIVTFNGDDFDLRYLKHRAEQPEIGIREEESPIALERVAASLKHGIHIDLYHFFRNKSIQVYAFGNKYNELTLNGVAEALLGKSKIEFDGEISDLPPLELANYCLKDSQLAYELTSMSSSIVMKLLLVISRIGKMPMNDVSRLGVSNWIRSMLFYEHRKMNALIPRQDELSEKGGASSQAIIKGKKYKGGLVIEPKPGVYFDVSVLDFASLYPSLIKVHNLSYETVNCPHEECRSNIVPDTSHWVCQRRNGVTSLVIGSLRDLRVSHYKPLARDPSLSRDDRELYNIVSQGLKVFLNACFTGDTDIVTPEGIRNIKDVRVGDRVVNINPETLGIEMDRVVEVQSMPYKGEMYHFRDRRFVDLVVTPNHRFLVRDNHKSSKTGTIFRTADEIYGLANMTIPKVRTGIEGSDALSRISLLDTAKSLGALAYIYPGGRRRLSSWFSRLPFDLRRKIRVDGSVNKIGSKKVKGWGSHYVVPSASLSEYDVDEVEKSGGFVLLGERMTSKVPARYDVREFASLCGWYVSEGSPFLTVPRAYPNGNSRGMSSGILLTQSKGTGNTMGATYRAEIGRLLERLGLQFITDSSDEKYHKVSSHVMYEWMLTNCYVDRRVEHNVFGKQIPRFVLRSRAAAESFLDAAYKGDGTRRQKLYSTKSKQLAEDMVVLLSLLGARSRIKHVGGIYRVTFGNTSTKLTGAGSKTRKYVTMTEHDGEVYCLTTERNHTVIAGRNGRYVHVGQSYGVMGFETFSFYCLPVAEATAAYGRDAITRTIQRCTELGIGVLYGDTDSLFLQNPSRDQVSEVTRWAEKELGVELDLDKTYRYVAFSSRKKNYFGVLPDGTVDIRGLTGKKSQTPEYLKETFYKALNILSQVKTEADFERAKAETKGLVTRMITQLKNRQVTVDKLAFNVMMGKPTEKYNGTTPQHVRAAKLLEVSGREVKAGEIIAYVKTKNPPYVKPVELAKVEEVDVEKYIEYAHSMFDQMLDALDFSFEEIMGATTLDLFWSS